MLSLCVTGDGLAGKTQRIAFTPASSYQASMARLQSSLQFDTPGATIKSVALWDKDFEEYVRIDSFDGLDAKAKIRVELNSSKELAPEMQAVLAVSEAAVTRLVESIGGASAVAVLAQIQQATREAMVTGDVAALSRAVAKAEAEAAVSTTPREAGRSAPRKASNPSSAASAAAEANPTPKRKKAAAPTELTPEAARVPRRFVVSPQANSPLKQMVARASSPVTRLTAGEQSMMTLFCVYNGSMSQRAKAIRINRDRPDWTAVLATLQAKFGCELALGYIENGSDAVVEILDGNHLADIIRSDCRDADSLTLQCWRPDGFGDYEGMDADQRQLAVQNARPGSALRGSAAMDSIRRPASTKGVGEKLDVSGALYNEEQLQALFDQIDIDGSGFLDIDEFRSFFKNQYDGMGINDVDAKFEKLLASTTAFEDGKLDFDEFAIIMLKISQW